MAIARVTEKQADFLVSLLENRHHSYSEESVAGFRMQLEGGYMRRSVASDLISYLISCPKKSAPEAAAEAAEIDPETLPVAPGYLPTVVDGNSHRTYRVKQAGPNSKLAGKYIIGFLAGPGNVTNYQGFGFVTPDGVKVWKRFSDDQELAEHVKVLTDPQLSLDAAYRYALDSGNCYKCNHLLTDPESIRLGIGPVCRAS